DIVNINLDLLKFYTYSWRIEEYIFNQLYYIDLNDLDDYINYIYDNLYNLIISIINSKYYIETLNKINSDKKNYIIKRNEAFKNKELKDFIFKSRENNNFFKLTPPIIYYGEN
ncbi:MAG: hypothetical protein Q4E75_05875, partial [bacterium]|nr:hypothetical protein [bacterium]